MSTALALSDSLTLAHVFSFPKSQTDGMPARVFEVPWAPVQKKNSALLTDPHLVWVSSWKNIWKITSIDELGIFLHAQRCCQSMSKGGRECWGECSFWTELWRRQGEIEVLRSFYSRIPFQITLSLPWGVGEDEKGVHHFWGKYFICQSVWQLQGEWCWTEVHILQCVVYRLVGVCGFTSKEAPAGESINHETAG